MKLDIMIQIETIEKDIGLLLRDCSLIYDQIAALEAKSERKNARINVLQRQRVDLLKWSSPNV